MRPWLALLVILLLPWLAQAAPACHADARLDGVFEQAQLHGTLVVLDAAGKACYGHDLARAATPYLPASTFKIFNAMTALETGVIRDEHVVFHWDGKIHDRPEWNQDSDLERGMQYSVLWYYQELARRIGAARMQAWIDRVGYGNRNISGGIDQFWLSGDLRISALQQVAFLQRLHDGRLPFSPRSQQIVRRILIREQTPAYTLRWKTGWTMASDPGIGWIVGWIERNAQPVYFALNIDMPDAGTAPKRDLALHVALHALGYLPEFSPP